MVVRIDGCVFNSLMLCCRRGGGFANGFWHSLAKIVAGVCEPGPFRAAGLTEASYTEPGRQNPLAPRGGVHVVKKLIT
jgi:hypothetical protein